MFIFNKKNNRILNTENIVEIYFSGQGICYSTSNVENYSYCLLEYLLQNIKRLKERRKFCGKFLLQ